MKSPFQLLAVLLAAAILAAGCGGGGRKEKAGAPAAGGKITIYTTVFPLFDFARNVGGERVEVFNLLPPGADPHHWEPTPGELVKIQKAAVFVYCGAGLEQWAENALKNVSRERTVVVDCSEGIDLMEESGHGDGHDREGDRHHSSRADPHIWLDPVCAGIMVDNILAGLTKADPAGKDYYTSNADNYKGRLARLDASYREALGAAKVKQFVVSHDAFGYLAKRYGLDQVPIRGVTAEGDPSPARMAEIVELVRKHGIKYIFCDSLASPAVSEAIARETGAKTLMLHHIASLTEKEWREGKNYLSLMEENLENLKKACQNG